jgi:hypothetical protein
MNMLTNWSNKHIKLLYLTLNTNPLVSYLWKLESVRTLATPFVVQHVAIIKLVSPLKGGIGLNIIPLPV